MSQELVSPAEQPLQPHRQLNEIEVQQQQQQQQQLFAHHYQHPHDQHQQQQSLPLTPERQRSAGSLSDDDFSTPDQQRELRKRQIRLQSIQIPPTPEFGLDTPTSPSANLSPVAGASPGEPHELALVSAVMEWQQNQERGKAQHKRKLQGARSPRSPMRSPQARGRSSSLLSPRSPRIGSPGPLSVRSSRRPSLSAEQRPRVEPFYFPQGVPMSPSSKGQALQLIDRCFNQGQTPGVLNVDEFMPVTTDVCEMSSFCNISLFLCVKRYERITSAQKADPSHAPAQQDHSCSQDDMPPSPSSMSPMTLCPLDDDQPQWSQQQQQQQQQQPLAQQQQQPPQQLSLDLRSSISSSTMEDTELDMRSLTLVTGQEDEEHRFQLQSQSQNTPLGILTLTTTTPEAGDDRRVDNGPFGHAIRQLSASSQDSSMVPRNSSQFSFGLSWPQDDGTPAGGMAGLVDPEPWDPAVEENWMEEQLRDGTVSKAVFTEFFFRKLAGFEPEVRFFRILCRDPEGLALERQDFQPLVHEIVSRHPGLRFLESTPEFQTRYGQTVVCRIFYVLDRHGRERITVRDIQRSNLLETLVLLDHEDDINTIHDYFSYEHFYVVYCQFWSLDSDHDGLIGAEDLLQYEEGSLSRAVIDRIVQGYGRPLLSNVPHRLCYEDFVIFFISEVDKTSPVSIDYWMRVVDVDSDQLVSVYELEFFFKEQQQRLDNLHLPDPISFPDILCQVIDMIKPIARTNLLSPTRKRLGALDFVQHQHLQRVLQQQQQQQQHHDQQELQQEQHEQEPEPEQQQLQHLDPPEMPPLDLAESYQSDTESAAAAAAAQDLLSRTGVCRRLRLDIDDLEVEHKESAAAAQDQATSSWKGVQPPSLASLFGDLEAATAGPPEQLTDMHRIAKYLPSGEQQARQGSLFPWQPAAIIEDGASPHSEAVLSLATRMGFRGFSKAEIAASGNAPALFNTLFNLNKFLINETKNAQAIHHRHATPELSDWDRFAVATYYELAEEEADGQTYEPEHWDSVLYEDDWEHQTQFQA